MLNLYPTHTDQPPNYTINGSTYQAGAIQEVVFNNFQASISNQTLSLTPPSLSVIQIPDGASTQGSLTVTTDLTVGQSLAVNGLIQANGNISCLGQITTNVGNISELNVASNATINGPLVCDSLTVTQGLSPSSAGFGFKLGGQLYDVPADVTELNFGNSFSFWQSGTV